MVKKLIKKLVKGVANPVLDGTGVYDGWLRKLEDQPTWTILMYHRVVADKSHDPLDSGMCVTRHRFEAQLTYLARSADIVPLGETVAGLASGKISPRRRMLSITFDDGYRDNLTEALPILQRMGLPMTLFVATGGLESNTPFWWDRVGAVLARTDRRQLALDLPGQPRLRLPLESVSQREHALKTLGDVLWAHADVSRDETVTEIERQLGVDGRRYAPPLLTPDEVVQMAKAGVEIAAHTVNHWNLARLPAAEVASEMRASREYLERLCGVPVTGFAYPAGHKSAEVVRMAREVGFAYAVSTVSGINRHPPSMFELERIGMPDSSVADFKRSWGAKARRGRPT
jgi:peptidoglycan/xylan/chitin deacetylase (PgdA/CDA1 family)